MAMIFYSRKFGARCMRIETDGVAVGFFRKPTKEMVVAVYTIEPGVTDTFSKLESMISKTDFRLEDPAVLDAKFTKDGFESSGVKIPLGEGELETVRRFIYGRV